MSDELRKDVEDAYRRLRDRVIGPPRQSDYALQPAGRVVTSLGHADGYPRLKMDDHSMTIRIAEGVRYDADQGTVVLEEWPNGIVKQALDIRKGVEEKVTRLALIAELERLGYTVEEGGAIETAAEAALGQAQEKLRQLDVLTSEHEHYEPDDTRRRIPADRVRRIIGPTP